MTPGLRRCAGRPGEVEALVCEEGVRWEEKVVALEAGAVGAQPRFPGSSASWCE